MSKKPDQRERPNTKLLKHYTIRIIFTYFGQAFMNPYQQKKRWKYILIAFAIIIAGGSLIYTNHLVKNISKSERTRAQVWAMSMRQTTQSDDNDFLQYVFAVRDSSLVPAIGVDERGDIKYVRGLDSTKSFIKIPGDEK